MLHKTHGCADRGLLSQFCGRLASGGASGAASVTCPVSSQGTDGDTPSAWLPHALSWSRCEGSWVPVHSRGRKVSRRPPPFITRRPRPSGPRRQHGQGAPHRSAVRDRIQDEHVEESAAGTWSQSSARQSHTEEPNTGETRLRDRPRHSLRGLQGPTRGVTGARDRCDAAARPARSCRPHGALVPAGPARRGAQRRSAFPLFWPDAEGGVDRQKAAF